MKDQLLRAESAPIFKALVSWLAAALGIGTFLGLVNLAVGILSATWLAVQLYGYLAHALPMKRMRKQMLARELGRGRTQPAELGRMGADE